MLLRFRGDLDLRMLFLCLDGDLRLRFRRDFGLAIFYLKKNKKKFLIFFIFFSTQKNCK
jgi:hypothetical protein